MTCPHWPQACFTPRSSSILSSPLPSPLPGPGPTWLPSNPFSLIKNCQWAFVFSPSYSSVSSCPLDPHLGGTMNIEYWLPCGFIYKGWSLQQRGETFQSWIYWSLSCPMDESCWFSPSHIATTHDCRATLTTLTHWENLVKHAFVKHRDILQIHPS